MSRAAPKFVSLLLAVSLVAGCQFGVGRPAMAIQYYDLGTPEPVEVDPCCEGRVALPRVGNAEMLASRTMWYRQDAESVRPRAFAVSRWSAYPANLLEHFLRVTLAVAEIERRDARPYALDLELQVMEQQFADSGSSTAVLIFSATLTRTADRSVLANRVFSLRGQAPAATPEGGAQALSLLVKESARQLQDWMCRHIRQDQGTQEPGP